MEETYRIHFSYSKRKRYPQAVELAELAHEHEVWGEGKEIWHIVTLKEEQGDLMASLYLLAKHLPFRGVLIANPENHYEVMYFNSDYFGGLRNCKAINKRVAYELERIRGKAGISRADLANEIHDRFLLQIWEDMSKVKDKLIRERRIEYWDYDSGMLELPENPPSEPVEIYRQITELIEQEKYSKAVDAYYESLSDQYYGVLTPELIYLKRLANIPLSGRDLLYFRPESSRKGLIESNLGEYVDCIDETLASLRDTNRQIPLEILLEYAPTVQEMIDQREHDWHNGVSLEDWEIERDFTPVTIDNFSFEDCPAGRLFDRYPDQVKHSHVFHQIGEPEYLRQWTPYPQSYVQEHVFDKGLHLRFIEVYEHRAWRYYRKEPDFTSIQSADELVEAINGGVPKNGLEYSGRVHRIEDQEYYEIITTDSASVEYEDENPFLELVNEILREAENLLRENHGVPRIGEGWISETELFWLVQQSFPDAQQHASPDWLKPQHLDVFVPSKKLAFEYQGRQHFEPVEFFGGKEAFENTVKRDKLKARKCKKNAVTLIPWKYTEPIDQETLLVKLEKDGIIIADHSDNED